MQYKALCLFGALCLFVHSWSLYSEAFDLSSLEALGLDYEKLHITLKLAQTFEDRELKRKELFHRQKGAHRVCFTSSLQLDSHLSVH